MQLREASLWKVAVTALIPSTHEQEPQPAFRLPLETKWMRRNRTL